MAQPVETVPHVYDDGSVTVERVQAFADAPVTAQLSALTALRRRTTADVGSAIAVASLAFAVLFALLTLQMTAEPGRPFWPTIPGVDSEVSNGWLWVGAQILVIAVLFRFAVSLSRDVTRRRNAVTLLGAYEAELARRHAETGRAARQWQRAHASQWRSSAATNTKKAPGHPPQG